MHNIKLFIKRELNENEIEKIFKIIVNDYKVIFQDEKKNINLKAYLLRFRFNIFKFNKKFWRNFILSISKKNRNKYQEQLRKILIKINLSDISIKDLNMLYLISLRMGIYNISNILRNLLKNKTYQEFNKKKNDQKYLLTYISCLIEDNKHKLAKKNLNKLRDPELRKLINNYNNLFLIKDKINENYFDEIYSKEFIEFINNKSLIVNCPSIKEKKINLNKYNIKIGMNYFNEKKNINNFNYSISYLSLEQCIYYIGKRKLSKNVKFYITRNEYSKNLLKKTYNRKGIRKTYNFKSLLFRGNLNLMPNLILDILMSPSKVKEIFIFNSDLMLTSQRSKNYYPKIWGREKRMEEIFQSKMVRHDPITQYLFLEKLLNHKLINGDQIFKKIFKRGLNDYLNQIEKIYGSFI